jgi:hypothetical protein
VVEYGDPPVTLGQTPHCEAHFITAFLLPMPAGSCFL